MKKILLFLSILLTTLFTSAQTPTQYVLRYDTVKIEKSTGAGNAELIVKNQQRGVAGIAYNRGNGWLGFKTLQESDIPSLSISKVTNLQSSLDSKANNVDVVTKAGYETITGVKTFQYNGIPWISGGELIESSIFLSNSTAAQSGLPQWSPAIQFSGSEFKTGPGPASSQPVSFRQYLKTESYFGASTSALTIANNNSQPVISLTSSNLRLHANGFTGAFNPLALTANRTFSLPDKSGTFALTSDITIDESNLVHKSGNETITGSKTFTLDILGTPHSTVVNGQGVSASNDATMAYGSLSANGMTIESPDEDKRVTVDQYGVTFGNSIGTAKGILTATTSTIGIGWNLPNKSGTIALLDDISTIDDSNLVHKTGDEMIGGYKVFSNPFTDFQGTLILKPGPFYLRGDHGSLGYNQDEDSLAWAKGSNLGSILLDYNHIGDNKYYFPDKTNSTIAVVGNTAPNSATDTGVLGEIRVTSTHIYVCTATNTWVRAALSTW